MKIILLRYLFLHVFLKKIEGHISSFVEPLIALFWTSGDVSSWFQSQSGQPYLHLVEAYLSLQLRMQNRRKKWNFLLNFWTRRKLSECYSGIFQTQSSWCASDVDHFRNFTELKTLNIWIVKYLLNCKRYLSYNFRIFQKISECWVLENLDVHLEWNTSELEFKSEKSKIVTFSLEFNGQVLVRQD